MDWGRSCPPEHRFIGQYLPHARLRERALEALRANMDEPPANTRQPLKGVLAEED